DIHERAPHLVGEADERHPGAELHFRRRDLHQLFAGVAVANARDRSEQPGTGLLEAVQGAGEGLGGVGDRRHGSEYAALAFKLLFRNAVNAAATTTFGRTAHKPELEYLWCCDYVPLGYAKVT